MRQLTFLIVVFICFPLWGAAVALLDQPKVDERVELLSIVFRLAGCEEYSSTKHKAYTDRINAHFELHKEHPLIRYTRKIRRYGIGYDAVMQMAIHIGEAPGFVPLKKFDKNTPEIRWGKRRANKFLNLLREFYVDAECEKFLDSEKEFYQEIVEAFMPVYKQLDLDWYATFYGTAPTERFVTILSPGNAGSNYGPNLTKADGTKEIYAILGVWKMDANAPKSFSVEQYFPILLHEFNHSFVNPVMAEFRDQLVASGLPLYQSVSKKMEAIAYGEWEVMLIESVVRAAVVEYMIWHKYSKQQISEEVAIQVDKGFLWMKDLLFTLEEYRANRERYPTFKDFMPELVKSFGQIRRTYANP